MNKSDLEKEFIEALKAIGDGYPSDVPQEGWIRVENPEFTIENGKNPFLVINVKQVEDFLWTK